MPQTVTRVNLTIPRPFDAQIAARKAAKRFNVLCWGRRAGKTTFAIKPVLEVVLDQGKPLGWFAPKYKILDPVWEYYKALLAPLIVSRSEKDYALTLVTGGQLEFWSMDTGIVARSRAYKRVIVDEAAFIPELNHRWQKEIEPTLTDYQGDAWFLSTPDGINDFKALHDMAALHNDWHAHRIPTWENPHLPQEERERTKYRAEVLEDPAARQEYGAEFMSGNKAFVPAAWVDACGWYNDFPALDFMTPICVGIDAASEVDTFAISGVGKDLQGRFIQVFCKIFYPRELRNDQGILSFDEPREFIKRIAQMYHVVVFAYDRYQLLDFAGKLELAGVGAFQEFDQQIKRVLADTHFKALIRDRNWLWNALDSDHVALAQHVRNSDRKDLPDERLRIVKRKSDGSMPNDAAVATSMACYALTEFNL